MTSKAEKLARELIVLSQRYSERDFDRANELLMSGELFAKNIEAVETARRSIGKGGPPGTAPQHRLPLKPSETRPPKARSVAEPLTPLDIDDFLGDLEPEEKRELSSFALRFQSREILESGSSARMFAQQLGVQLPKSIPARAVLLKTLLKRLIDLPPEARGNLVKEANRIGSGESSLQRWSDLIVKPG